MRIARRAVAFFREDRLFAALFGALLLLYTLPLAIPNQVSMIGLELYNQVVDIANLCVSDGIVARVGR